MCCTYQKDKKVKSLQHEFRTSRKYSMLPQIKGRLCAIRPQSSHQKYGMPQSDASKVVSSGYWGKTDLSAAEFAQCGHKNGTVPKQHGVRAASVVTCRLGQTERAQHRAGANRVEIQHTTMWTLRTHRNLPKNVEDGRVYIMCFPATMEKITLCSGPT